MSSLRKPSAFPLDVDRARRLVERSPNKGCAALVYSVLDNRMTGQIIVEAQNAPRAAIIAAKDTAYLFTKPDFANFKTLGPFLREYLQSGVSDEGVTLWATAPEQVSVLQTMFSLETRRIVFSFPEVSESSESSANSPKNDPREDNCSGGYRLETFVDKEGECSGEEATPEAATCFGTRMIYAETVVSACYSDLFAGGQAEIQIRTHPDFRRKGLAFKVAQRFIEQAHAFNLRPAWSCDEDNIASYALATRLGFIGGSRLYGYYLHPTFLLWRENPSGKIGPSPEASTAGFEEEATVKAADAVLDCLLEAYEASTVQEHLLQMLVLPQPNGIVAQWIEASSCRLIQVVRTFPIELREALTAQFKFRAGMHINRQGFPQRGRFAVARGTTKRIIRLAVYPSEYGEKMLLSVA